MIWSCGVNSYTATTTATKQRKQKGNSFKANLLAQGAQGDGASIKFNGTLLVAPEVSISILETTTNRCTEPWFVGKESLYF